MKKSDMFSLILPILLIVMITTIIIRDHAVTKDNFFFIYMLIFTISQLSSTITNHFTNVMNREDPAKVYSEETILHWSKINEYVHIVFIIGVLAMTAFTWVKFPDQKMWLLLGAPNIGFAIFMIFREHRLRRSITRR